MNDNHYPKGSSKGGQFAPKGENGVVEAMGLDETNASFDLPKQRKLDAQYSKTALPALGSYVPEIQQTAVALHDQSMANEAPITNDMKSIAKIIGGDLVGLDNVVKSPASIAHKIQENMEYYGNTAQEAIEWCDDLVRYTVLFQPSEFANGTNDFIESLISKGYQVKYLQNRYLTSKTGMVQEGYKDIGLKLLSPNGHKVEVQFMVPKMYAAKNGLSIDEYGNLSKRTDGIMSGHDYYDMQKQAKTSDMPEEEKQERLAYLDYMNKTIYKDIEIPQGVENIRREKYYGE